MCKEMEIRTVALEAFRHIANDEGIGESYNIVFDLKFDSIDMVEVVMEIEDKFDISIDEQDYADCITVEEFINRLVKNIGVE